MNIISKKNTSYLLTFIFGAFCNWLIDGANAGIPRSANPISAPIPIKLSKIKAEDDWIKSFQLAAVPLDKIESNREYLLLILKKKPEISEVPSPDIASRFVLKGLADQEAELWLTINPTQLKRADSDTYTLLLDFGGGLFRQKQILLTEGLEIASMEVSQ